MSSNQPEEQFDIEGFMRTVKYLGVCALLILIAVCIVAVSKCSAQNNSAPPYRYQPLPISALKLYKSKNDADNAAKTKEIGTMEAIIEYANICFNDSTERYYYTSCDGLDCWEIPCNKGFVRLAGELCPRHVEHRKPTFEGFIDYIQKKYGY